MTNTEKRLLDFAQLVLSANEPANDNVGKILTDHANTQARAIVKEFEKKVKSDGRKRKTKPVNDGSVGTAVDSFVTTTNRDK